MTGTLVDTLNLDAALAIAAADRRVLPCWWITGELSKAPIGKLVPKDKDEQGRDVPNSGGIKKATTDPDVIRSWWKESPKALVGAVIPDHLVVVDVDPRHGGSLESLEHRAGGRLPTTLTSWSGRGDGGCHLYFGAPAVELSSAELNGTGIDLLRGGRKYVIAPPSLHPDTGQRYYWEHSPVVPLPAFLVKFLTPKAPATPPRTWKAAPVARVSNGRLTYWLNRLATTNKRNDDLFWIANEARRAGVLDQVADQLIDAAAAAGLDHHEIAKTLQSAREQTR